MAVQPGQVARLTQAEINQLTSWNFIKSYNKRQRELVDLAKSVYISTCTLLQARPTEAQFYRAYSSSLKWADIYVKKILRRKIHLPPSVHEYFADLLAKYVLEQHWLTISSVPWP